MTDEYRTPQTLTSQRQQIARIAGDTAPVRSSRDALRDLEYLYKSATSERKIKTGEKNYGDGITAADALLLVSDAETELDKEAARVLHSKEGYPLGLRYGFGVEGMEATKAMLRERVNEKQYDNIFDAPATALAGRRQDSRKRAFG